MNNKMNYRTMKTKPVINSGMKPKASRRNEMKTKVTKYNDHFTKYENKDAVVTVDSDSKELKISLKNGKNPNPDKIVLHRECNIVFDNVKGTIKAYCDAFTIEIDRNTNYVTLTMN